MRWRHPRRFYVKQAGLISLAMVLRGQKLVAIILGSIENVE